ncbi:MAG: RNase adapter RapZ [Elusimicrobia bacterium]|nr:RNase adapter RapZ [Elusimicrobiota bacterium]
MSDNGKSSKNKLLVILTGISGAGKSQALKCFEDFGFYCVDNLPIALLDRFGALVVNAKHLHRVALGIDIREGRFLGGLSGSLRRLRGQGLSYRIIFLDASDRVVVQRFSETRHRHPLGTNIVSAVRQERKTLMELKGISDKVIDTSGMTLGELKETLSQTLDLKRKSEMNVSVVSFGYKYGLPMDADLVFDVRFMPNPNYVAGLKQKNGLDAPVQRYLLKQPACREFMGKISDLISSLLPHYIREGKSYLTVAVGCTGGHHRSVFITHDLATSLHKRGYAVREFHRDINR